MAKAPAQATRVIGIDPGLNLTGYAVVEWQGRAVRLLEGGVIRSPRASGNNLPLRLESLFKGVSEVLEEFRPQAMCLEEVYSHTDYPRTSILMGHARGVICLAARRARIPVMDFSAKRIKQSVTGNGGASKMQVQRAVQQAFSLHRLPEPPDVADALAAALCYVNWYRVKRLPAQSSATRGSNGARPARKSSPGTSLSGGRP
jgi:crossover junction endodeoxyribonuclease RuvC